MNKLAIRVSEISKRFRINQLDPRRAAHELIENAVREPFSRLYSVFLETSHNNYGRKVFKDEYIWALKNISFEVKHGEVLGIIGPNGAGKSVLLRILSRVTKPTRGYAEIYGKFSSMLEVGTGFHPELTGRENMYMSGTILGMERDEIKLKFDEIVEFSEVERFIDTPVKRYSSGMNVRLAFAIAAHLDSEIMILDEVLAVGDKSFKDKCIKKMRELVSEGRTVLFVSHDMNAIENFCDKGIYLNHGEIVMSGEIKDVVSYYLSNNTK